MLWRRRSACGCAPAARTRRRPRRSASTSTATSSSRSLVSGALRRPRRRLPRAGRLQRLPERPDRRPRLHRPGRDDLRQLASRRAAARRAAVRLHRRAPAAQRRASPCTRCCCSSRVGLLALAVVAAPYRRATRGPSWSRSSSALAFLVWYLTDRRGAARVHRDDAVRRHAAGAGLRVATTADARGRRPALPQGQAG